MHERSAQDTLKPRGALEVVDVKRNMWQAEQVLGMGMSLGISS